MGKGFRCFSHALVGVALILAGTSTAWAHTDPSGATATGVSFSLSAFRVNADGSIGAAVFPNNINQCETVILRATLSYNTSTQNGINAAFQGGTLSITTPDGVVHPATPAGGIPCVGGTDGVICDPAITSINSLEIPFTAAVADCTATPLLSASASYTNGRAHIGADLAGVVSAGAGFGAGTNCCVDDGLVCNGIIQCDPATRGQFCLDPATGNVCDASNTNGDGQAHQGTCVAGTPVTCQDDGNVCNGPETCSETSVPPGQCVSGPPAPDSTVCSDTDGVACTTAGCDGNGTCDQNHISTCGGVGRMTGGGSIFRKGGGRMTHGFELHCNSAELPNNLEINWDKGNNFHLETLTSAVCSDDPNINPHPPSAPFDTYVGTGTGTCNGVSGATITFTLTDAGEPGKNDTATFNITGCPGGLTLSVSGNLKFGNQQAHAN
ncbi:MAG TPA: hypothetical protein VGK70_05870 [Thermoanaerobaculia bacterium]|jgi:hypothetical protein